MNEILGSNIMRLRKENDLTQEQLANGLGITYQAVSKWETGVSSPDISMLPLLADVFEVSIDELFGREGPARGSVSATEEKKKETAPAGGVVLPWPDDEDMLHVVLFAGHKLIARDEIEERLDTRRQIEFCYEGPALNIWSDFSVSCGDVQGSVSAGGDVNCEDIGGEASAQGDVSCGDVKGSVEAKGNVNCDAVGRGVTAGGSVNCDEVGSGVSAGGDVSCDGVAGAVSAGGNVTCDDVAGSVYAGGDVTCDSVGKGVSATGSMSFDSLGEELSTALSGLGARISNAVNKSIKKAWRFDRTWSVGDHKAEVHLDLDLSDEEDPEEDEKE